MTKPPRQPLKLATIAGERESGDSREGPGPVPPEGHEAPSTIRVFGVPFMKGAAREVTSIHMCPSMIHLATIRDGFSLEVLNRLTMRSVDLGDLHVARLIAFRPRGEGIELAIAGARDKPDLARYDLKTGRVLESLPLEAATAIQYSGDGRFVAAGSLEGRVKVWHLGAEGPRKVLETVFEAQVESLAFHPEHPTVYATLASGALVELALAPGLAAPVGAALRERAPGVLFHRVASGRWGYPIYLAGRDHRVYMVDTVTGEVGVLSPKVGPITGLQVLPTSGHLCVLGPHTVFILPPPDPKRREHLAQVCAFEETVYAAWELEHDAMLVFHASD